MVDYISIKDELRKISKELFSSGSTYDLIASTDIDRVISHLNNLEKNKELKKHEE